MRMTWLRGAGFFGFLAIAAACSSSSDNGSTGGACTPGDSKSCTGTGGCAGAQVCNGDGSAYGTCDCGSSDAGGSKDSGGGNSDSGSDAGSFTPNSLTGIVFWADGASASTADGGGVSTWTDLSSGHHDFSTASGDPQLVTSGAGSAPAVSFTTADSVGADLGAITVSSGYVLELVATDISGTGDVFGCGSTLSDDGAGNLYFSVDEGAKVAVPAGTHLYSIDWSSSAHQVTLRIDGAATVSIAAAGGALPGGDVALTLDSTLTETISEVVVAHDVSAADEGKLETYLKSKYGL